MYRNTFSGLLPGSLSKRRRGKSDKPGKKGKEVRSTSTRVLVAGVNGKLGPHVVRHLLATNLEVTLYTTNPILASATFPDIPAIIANYDDLQSQIPFFQGFDIFVILISRAQDAIQPPLIDAAIEAGIKHIIPSSFGIDTRDSKIQENPLYAPKIAIERHLEQRVAEGRVTFTIIQIGVLLEWGLQLGIPINLTGTTSTILFDGGDTPFSTSSTDDVGRAVARALTLREDDRVRNQVLRMHSIVTTQNNLLRLAHGIRPDVEWKTVAVDTESGYNASLEAWGRGERDPASLRGLMPRMTYGLGLGLFERNDNALLGLQEWEEERLKGVVENVMGRVTRGEGV